MATELDAFTKGSATRSLGNWLAGQGVSLAVSCYDANNVAAIGHDERGDVSISVANFPRAMGIAGNAEVLMLSSLDRVWMLWNVGGTFQPRVAHYTGDVDTHELAIDGAMRPVFVATRYSCLATISQAHGIAPIWAPPFISALAPEDRCHLNGMAMEDGLPRYVTCVHASDSAEGWVDRRAEGGSIIDVASGKVVTDKLVMPHSPRVHNGRLYVLDSGTGWLCEVDRRFGDIERIAFLPGFARGMTMVGGYAVIALSKSRAGFDLIPLGEELIKRKATPWCAVVVVSLRERGMQDWLRLGEGVNELFDVAALPLKRPQIMGPDADDLRNRISVDPVWQPLDPRRPYVVREVS